MINEEQINKIYQIRDYFFNEILDDKVRKSLGKKRVMRYYKKFDEYILNEKICNRLITNFDRMKLNGYFDYVIKKYGKRGRETLMITTGGHVNEIEILGITKGFGVWSVLGSLYPKGAFDDEDKQQCEPVMKIIDDEKRKREKFLKDCIEKEKLNIT